MIVSIVNLNTRACNIYVMTTRAYGKIELKMRVHTKKL